ncbi:potassium transporter TrkG [Pontibacter ruber]|uniref:Potassium transporter TrkG n=1 Tax=Pontibacter ruber TaxID=1343895 RepID=A0ABW5CTW8_9BACT|nr:potassium transporter TrkG [Pontibacter ruber]
MNTESLNRFLYGSKLLAYAIMRRTSYVLTIVSVALLLYAHGMVQYPVRIQTVFHVINGILGVFVLIYLLRILYTFERVKFLRRTWFEGLLMAIIFGGIGFPAILDVLSPNAMRQRMAALWRNWKLLTRVTVYTSAALLAFGTVMFYFNTLSHLNFGKALITAFFQSTTTRSAGFHTVDISDVSAPALLICKGGLRAMQSLQIKTG